MKTENIIKSKQKAAESLFSKTHSIINAIMDGSPNLVVMYDANGDLVYANNNSLAVFNIKQDDSNEHLNLFTIFKHLDPYSLSRLKDEEVATFDLNNQDIKTFSTDENNQNFRVSISPVLDNTDIIGYLCIYINISDIVKKDNKIHRLNQYVEHLLRESNMVLWRFYFTDVVNSKISGELVFGKPDIPIDPRSDFEDFIASIAPEVAGEFLDMVKEMLGKNMSEKITKSDYKVINPETGEIFYHRCSFFTIINNDDTHEVLCAVNSITDLVRQRKEIEINNFKSTLLMKGGGLKPWELDLKARNESKVDKNNEIYETQINQVREFFEHITPESREIVKNQVEKLYTGEDVSLEYEFGYKNENDDIQYIRSYVTPFEKDETGKVIKYIGYNKDITENKKLIVALEKALVEAENADKLKSQFLANMTHEIRTPLNAIVGFSEMLSYARTPEDKRKWQKYIYSNTDLLLHLINDILDLSRLESGAINITKTEFDFAAYFDEIANSLGTRMRDSDIEFIVDNPFKKLIINSDRGRLAQIITNFTTNAIKNTDMGYIKVGYEFNDGILRIYVKDSGCGISEENVKKLFNRFEKLDSNTQGAGLGLAIIKAIVTRLEGTCGCESEIERGSCFWANIPVETSNFCDVTDINPTNYLDDNTDDNIVEFSGDIKVLVAEDNEGNFELISSILYGMDITHATNGRDAVLYMKENSFDVVLMDIRMPIMNGDEAIRVIRSFDKDTPIIVLTANAFDSNRVEVLQAGANDYVTKPIRREVIIKTIMKYINI